MSESPPPPHGRAAKVLLGLYLVLAVAAIVWPGPLWIAERVEPRVLGVPFQLAWHGFWIVATCAALVAFECARTAER